MTKDLRRFIRDLKKLKLDDLIGKKELRRCAEIVRLERRKTLRAGKQITGEKMPPLKKATIKAKRKKGYELPTKPLIATGVLTNVEIEVGDNYARLNMPKSREDVAQYHQDGAGNNPVRLHIGITDKAVELINEYVESRFDKWLRKHLHE